VRRVVPVVWVELEPGGCELLLACGHTVHGACGLYETVCFTCPEVHPGDQGPLDGWTPLKTVRFTRQAGGVA
jgi:hypothetical protein